MSLVDRAMDGAASKLWTGRCSVEQVGRQMLRRPMKGLLLSLSVHS